jgi:aryl-alcohol dehydrogenase-like predicted oxidoreductase
MQTREPGNSNLEVSAVGLGCMVAFAMSQPEDADVNEIPYRPTAQEL